MGRYFNNRVQPGGFSLVELLVVLTVLGICFAAGSVIGAQLLHSRESKGGAQAWQAAVAWAQAGVLWHGGKVTTALEPGTVSLVHDLHLCGAQLGAALPLSVVRANQSKWQIAGGIVVAFGGRLASPDAGGSLFFGNGANTYRVVLRPESGLTARTVDEWAP